jgi:hypothetical protein
MTIMIAPLQVYAARNSSKQPTAEPILASYRLTHAEDSMASDSTYTADQVATAARELREAAGAEEELFTGEQVISMLGEEVLLLRERGFSDERIAGLFTAFDIDITPEQIADHAPPRL